MDAATHQIPKTTLLIVDDDPLMTGLFETFMVKRGYRVLKASSGAEALRIADADPKRIALVITDMTMPEMDGLELAAQLGSRIPALPVILTTGHEAGMEIAADLPNVVDVVQKPYQNRDMAERIREILGALPA